MEDIYKKIGIKPIINAAGTYTVLGGSRMSRRTLEQMGQAASGFVQLRELQETVHRRLAEMTRNEAAYVATGAAAGLYLAVAAAIQEKLGKAFYYLDREEIGRCNVVMFKAHRNPYDLVVGQLGAQYRELSFPNLIHPPTPGELRAALDGNTAAVLYTLSGWTAPGDLDLDTVIALAKEAGVPVIVDAAAQLPPAENLWNITGRGADAAVFSGGKDLRGPQASGLVVGRRRLLEGVAGLGFPNYGIGRMLKVGREEMVGLLAAVEQYLEMDHGARRAWCEAQVDMAREALADSPLFTASRSFPNEAGQPIPRAYVELAEGRGAQAVADYLLKGAPAVQVYTQGDGGFYLNPMTLEEGEMAYILGRLRDYQAENTAGKER